MNLNISGHHLDLTPPLRDYVTEKLKRLERHFDHLINAEVILSVDKIRHRAEARVHASGADLYAEAVVDQNDTMYAAIDALIDKLDKQTRRHKERVRDHHVKEAVKRVSIEP